MHALEKTNARYILDRRMRSFIQHREPFLVDADVARHDSPVGRDQEHLEAYFGPSLPRLARVCLDARRRLYLRNADDHFSQVGN